jgi:ATP-dependent HslUV protease ATP-binding subunit HslU
LKKSNRTAFGTEKEEIAVSKSALTPREIVQELDKYIVGQKKAKKSVAVALRNRYRRSLLEESLREEIVPKNILMIGPTGVGKTEIARRLAKLVGAPFVKVEATKFTEVGYVGRDVESMVRDLVETSIRMVKAERTEKLQDRAERLANDRLIALLAPNPSKNKPQRNPLEMLFGSNAGGNAASDTADDERDAGLSARRQQVREQLARGELENEQVEIEVEDNAPTMFDMLGGQNNEQMGMNIQEMFGNLMPKKTKKRKLAVREARKVLTQEEAHKLLDMDEVIQEAVARAEQSGIIFIDEIDKIASAGRGAGPDVSREGVQRDILPIVEGSTVMTKYGPVKTDFVLFMAAGAFHVSKPSDLIPELQGRFPIRVELSSLTLDDFVSILTEPKNALTKQYTALLETEGIRVVFAPETIREIARIAADVNQNTENIGARRLHTILEKLLEDLSFEAPDITLEEIVISPEYVREKLGDIAQNRDLSQYIL